MREVRVHALRGQFHLSTNHENSSDDVPDRSEGAREGGQDG